MLLLSDFIFFECNYRIIALLFLLYAHRFVILYAQNIPVCMNFRTAAISDLAEMQQLYSQTIRSVCHNDYDASQIEAWTSGIANTQRWMDMIQNQYVQLAIINDKIAGFATLLNGNYIDFFYIHKDFQGQNIATKLLANLEEEARRNQAEKITSDISITAKPFFTKKGFVTIVEQQNMRHNVILINYKMEKLL